MSSSQFNTQQCQALVDFDYGAYTMGDERHSFFNYSNRVRRHPIPYNVSGYEFTYTHRFEQDFHNIGDLALEIKLPVLDVSYIPFAQYHLFNTLAITSSDELYLNIDTGNGLLAMNFFETEKFGREYDIAPCSAGYYGIVRFCVPGRLTTLNTNREIVALRGDFCGLTSGILSHTTLKLKIASFDVGCILPDGMATNTRRQQILDALQINLIVFQQTLRQHQPFISSVRAGEEQICLSTKQCWPVHFDITHITPDASGYRDVILRSPVGGMTSYIYACIHSDEPEFLELSIYANGILHHELRGYDMNKLIPSSYEKHIPPPEFKHYYFIPFYTKPRMELTGAMNHIDMTIQYRLRGKGVCKGTFWFHDFNIVTVSNVAIGFAFPYFVYSTNNMLIDNEIVTPSEFVPTGNKWYMKLRRHA